MTTRLSAKGGHRRRQGNFLAGAALISIGLIVGALILSRDREPLRVEQAAPIVAAFDSVQVPVPAEPVAAGAPLREVRFVMMSYPAHQVPEGSIRSLAEVKDGVALTALPANLPLFARNIARSSVTTNAVLERIPPGMRAMTINVDATSAVEGWARPGSLVDVLLVTPQRTTVVAEKVKILSAERSVAPGDSPIPNVPSTVTLLTTQEQTLAINTAIPMGKIAFALRSSRDDANWSATTFTPEQLKGGSTGSGNAEVSGYVSIRDGDEVKSFALSEGKWIESAVVPQGFRLSDDDVKAQQRR